MPIQDVVLMCHAPIVIPTIAGSRLIDCESSTNAMKQAAQHLVSKKPDLLVVLSPHTPRPKESYSIAADSILKGDFSRFGFPNLGGTYQNSISDMEYLIKRAKENGVPINPISIELDGMDHGASVPLHFMKEAGWNNSLLLIGFPWDTNNETHLKLGKALAQAAQASGKTWALLASGDMSHRLIQGAPAGYHPRAKEFDEYFVTQIKKGDIRAAINPEPKLREIAAEDVIDSVAVAGSAIDFDTKGFQFLSYEGPFGVGYFIAILREA